MLMPLPCRSFIVIPKTLVQLGYEPLPAVPHTNFLGMKGYLRPNAFKMCGLLYGTHGHDFLLTGFTTRCVKANAWQPPSALFTARCALK